jgi:RHS repeat-associated protein
LSWGYCTGSKTGFVLCTSRYYDPAAGGWLSRDPIGYAGGANLYAYCGGNPVGTADPSGLMMIAGVDVSLNTLPSLADTWVFNGAISHLGDMVGRYHAGCASGWDVAGAGLNASVQVAMVFAPELEAVKGLDVAFEAAEKLAGPAKLLLAKAKCVLTKSGCFAAGTPVRMADGTTKPIDQVKEGDEVESRDARTGKTEAKRVSATVAKRVDDLVTLTLADAKGVPETVVCTPNHPFYVPDKGFVPAGELAVGEHVAAFAGPALTVMATASSKPEGGVAVYNLVVEGDHTYFVGLAGGGAWVHNGACSKIPARGWGHSQEYRDALNALKTKGQRDFEASSEAAAKQFAEDGGLVKNPDPNPYGDAVENTYQQHEPEPDTLGRDPRFWDWPHLKYQFEKGNVGHIFYPPAK